MTDVLAQTTAGSLRGADLDGIKTFKGIPYAEAPIGALRFRPPRPAQRWSGVREALAYGPSSPQPTARPQGWSQEQASSEDCLYLNVWTPGIGGGPRPVMVWIHGGGYSIGSGSWPLYDGAALARRGDVVVVTVNHRLGPLGYLHLGELAGDEFAASGNNGMLDLVVVLEWVRDNIANFGGDPGNVTIFGESGGGAKVSTLLAMPQARGLFHRAAIQSGPGLQVASIDRATRAARSLLEGLGIGEENVADLWSVPTDKFIEATSAAGLRMGFSPVLDGTVIPAHPRDALENGSATDVPVIIGCNRDEVPPGGDDVDDAALRTRLAAVGEEHVDEIVAVYRDLHPDATAGQIAGWAFTDAGMRAGSTRFAEAKMKGTASPVFMYFFTYELAGRAGHGYEIAFVFDNIGRGGTAPSERRQALADQMSEAWLAFARDGDPNHSGIPKWPGYTLPERATMVFGREGAVIAEDPAAPARELWAKLPPIRRGRAPIVGA